MTDDIDIEFKNYSINPSHLIEIWKTFRTISRHQIDFIFNNAKFIYSFSAILLGVYFSVLSISEELLPTTIRYSVLIAISLFALTLLIFGIRTTRRDYDRFLEFIAYLNKIEYLLGLHQKLKLPIFPEDAYLFQRFVISTKKYTSTKDFIESERKRKGNLFYSLKIFYYMLLSIFVILLIISCYYLLGTMLATAN